MVTKTVLRQYSRGERVVLSGLFLAVAVCLAWLASIWLVFGGGGLFGLAVF